MGVRRFDWLARQVVVRGEAAAADASAELEVVVSGETARLVFRSELEVVVRREAAAADASAELEVVVSGETGRLDGPSSG
jgi:hypothetical protein